MLEELALLLPLLVLFDIEEDEEDAAGTEALEEDLEDVEYATGVSLGGGGRIND